MTEVQKAIDAELEKRKKNVALATNSFNQGLKEFETLCYYKQRSEIELKELLDEINPPNGCNLSSSQKSEM